jgi:hypothetical protein
MIGLPNPCRPAGRDGSFGHWNIVPITNEQQFDNSSANTAAVSLYRSR